MTSTVYYPGGYNPKLQAAKKRNNRTRTHQRPKTDSDHGPLQLPYNTFRVKEFLVTNVAGIGYLYGQPLEHAATETMTELSEEIEASFRDGQAAAVPVNQIQEGGLYGARYSEDNKFYRCTVIDKNPPIDGSIHVRYVDFGNDELIPRDSLVSLLSHLESRPITCRTFRLADCVNVRAEDCFGDNVLSEVYLWLINLVSNKAVTMLPQKLCSPDEVLLYFEGELLNHRIQSKIEKTASQIRQREQENELKKTKLKRNHQNMQELLELYHSRKEIEFQYGVQTIEYLISFRSKNLFAISKSLRLKDLKTILESLQSYEDKFGDVNDEDTISLLKESRTKMENALLKIISEEKIILNNENVHEESQEFLAREKVFRLRFPFATNETYDEDKPLQQRMDDFQLKLEEFEKVLSEKETQFRFLFVKMLESTEPVPGANEVNSPTLSVSSRYREVIQDLRTQITETASDLWKELETMLGNEFSTLVQEYQQFKEYNQCVSHVEVSLSGLSST